MVTMINRAILCTIICCVHFTLPAQKNLLPLGVHICGSEFGEDKLPGKLNVDYIYPNTSEIAYFAAKGFKVIDLPFRWERIQHTPGGALEADEINEIRKFVTNCSHKNLKVILSMHNFGRYKLNGQEFIIGSPQVTKEQYKNVWKQLAAIFSQYGNIYAYDIMSEPHDMWGYSWYNSAQAAIEGIREVDKNKHIIVGGDNYSNPTDWMRLNDGLKYLKDPSNKIIYDAHCYFDGDKSGHYNNDYAKDGAYTRIGVDRVKPFVEWLKRNNKQGIIGEFGVPSYDNRWLAVMDIFLQYLSEQNITANYWAAGSWWYNYPLSIQPVYGTDKPQMLVLQKFLTGGNTTAIFTSSKNTYSTTSFNKQLTQR